MSVSKTPEDSRRLAQALNRGEWTPDERIRAASAADRAATWQDLPQWLRDKVADTEQGA
jgi:hypothetical protein